MAGIAFELRKKLQNKKLSSILLTFGYSAFLSSGAWVISILSIMLASYIVANIIKDTSIVSKFQVSVTYLISLSLILSGPFQFYISRFTADRIFEKDYVSVFPNFFTAVILNMFIGFILYLPFSIYLFKQVSSVYTLLSLFSFVILCGEWVATSILTGLKSYNFIVYAFILGYFITVIFIYLFGYLGLNALMLGFFIGQTIIFLSLIASVIHTYPSHKIFSMDFLKRKNFYITLILTGLFYNLGIWIDKFVFWFSPLTSIAVFSHLRASAVYDTPIFLAYLAMVPGMAVFFLKLEGEFAGYYANYYKAILSKKTIEEIYKLGNEMILSARNVVFDVIRIHAVAVIIIILTTKLIFSFFRIPFVYIPIFHILLIGTALQLILMVLLGFLFYFDKRGTSLFISFLFFILNLLFTYLSIQMGPYYYGYGYALSLLISVITSLIFIRGLLNEIHYRTYMFN